MKRSKIKIRRAFTLIELVVTMVMAVIVISGIAIAMADSQRGWNQMYDRVHGEVVTDAYVARVAFDAVCRKASTKSAIIGDGGGNTYLRIYYFSDPFNLPPEPDPDPDSSATFIFDQDAKQLQVVHGTGSFVLDPSTGKTYWQQASSSDPVILANNVTVCKFSAVGACKMILTIDNGKDSLTIMCSSVRHN